MIGIVDSSACITGGNKNDTFDMLKEKMRADTQLWHNLLWVSEGKLKLSKCGYHLVHFNFNTSGILKM